MKNDPGTNSMAPLTLDSQETSLQNQGVRLDSAHTMAFFNYGIELYNSGNKELAKLFYKFTLQLVGNDATSCYNMALDLSCLGQQDESKLFYEQVISLEATDVQSCCNKGISFSALERYEEAIILYDQAINIASNEPEAYIAWIHSTTGELHKQI